MHNSCQTASEYVNASLGRGQSAQSDAQGCQSGCARRIARALEPSFEASALLRHLRMRGRVGEERAVARSQVPKAYSAASAMRVSEKSSS